MPKRSRRFLLRADDATRVYLDLATGHEVIEPAPTTAMPRARKSPKAASLTDPNAELPTSLDGRVASCLDALGLRYDRFADGNLRVVFQSRLLHPVIRIECLEPPRTVRCRLSLQVEVPPSRHDEIHHALGVLNAEVVPAQLLFNAASGQVEAFQTAFLGDLDPTPPFMEEQIRAVMFRVDALHHALLMFVMRGDAPARIAEVVEEAIATIDQLWPEQAADDEPA